MKQERCPHIFAGANEDPFVRIGDTVNTRRRRSILTNRSQRKRVSPKPVERHRGSTPIPASCATVTAKCPAAFLNGAVRSSAPPSFGPPQSRALPHRPAGLPSSIRERLRSWFPGLQAAYERRGSGLPEYLRDVSEKALEQAAEKLSWLDYFSLSLKFCFSE